MVGCSICPSKDFILHISPLCLLNKSKVGRTWMTTSANAVGCWLTSVSETVKCLADAGWSYRPRSDLEPGPTGRANSSCRWQPTVMRD